jgi:hypothetical protein
MNNEFLKCRNLLLELIVLVDDLDKLHHQEQMVIVMLEYLDEAEIEVMVMMLNYSEDNLMILVNDH